MRGGLLTVSNISNFTNENCISKLEVKSVSCELSWWNYYVVNESKKRLTINYENMVCMAMSKRDSSRCPLNIGDVNNKHEQKFNYLDNRITTRMLHKNSKVHSNSERCETRYRKIKLQTKKVELLWDVYFSLWNLQLNNLSQMKKCLEASKVLF